MNHLSSPTISRMARRAGTALGIVAALFTLCAAGSEAVTPVRPAPTPATHRPAPLTLHATTCRTAAPSTAAGYTALFNTLPSKQWGAADGAETVALPDGRSLWLFGDTFSDDRFVHSTAIVQDRGCLHVSHAGAQLLPNDPDGAVYWIDHAANSALGHVTIVAERMLLTGSCTFCFQDTGVTMAADVTVSAAGDVTFARWIGPARKAEPAVTLSYPAGALDVNYRGRVILHLQPVAHEWLYSPWLHRELRLASGKTLLSMGHNWDDGRTGLENYRPIFREVTLP